MLERLKSRLKFRTLIAQTPGNLISPHNGLTAPIHFSTTYTRNDANAYDSEYVYGRSDNVTLRHTEALLALLEGGREAMLFGSGMSAAIAVIMAFDRPIHVIASSQMYYGLRKWLSGIGRFGHSITFVDTTDLDALRLSIRERAAQLIWIETPSNPLWTITDISAVADLAHASGAIVCVDSTIATPVFTNPLAHGADIVMHSATKYLNGHSDVNAGALVVAETSELWARIAEMRAEQGVGLGAMEAWLLARGMRTLDLRVRTQAKTAALLAEKLHEHPLVTEVFYPGLGDHPGHAVAARQMNGGFGAMLSFRVCGGGAMAIKVASQMQLWRRATSLGGVESLIEHRASMEGCGPNCPDDLLRLSVGIEDPDDLFDDLDCGLQMLKSGYSGKVEGGRR
jgi:cystathionine gamma-synthase